MEKADKYDLYAELSELEREMLDIVICDLLDLTKCKTRIRPHEKNHRAK